MTEYDLVEFRYTAAQVLRAWRKEGKTKGIPPGRTLRNHRRTLKFISTVMSLAGKYGDIVTTEIVRKPNQ